MSLAIAGMGTALPAHSLPQKTSAAWSQAAAWGNGRRRLIPAVFLRTGIEHRYSVVLEGEPVQQTFFPPARDADDGGPTTRARMQRYAQEAGPLALRAARAALADERSLTGSHGTDVSAADITHVVTVSCSGFVAPGFDVQLIKDLGLPLVTARTHVGFMGCHGALNGLRVAHAFVRADPGARVLLCAVEMCSLHYDYRTETARILANALFADGAAALVATSATPAGSTAPPPWRHVASGSTLLPDSEGLMSWSIGDNGFEMGLSAEVPDMIAVHLRPWLTDWLRAQGLPLEAVGSWAIHPGGPRILDAVAASLDLPPEATADSRAVLAAYGNMSSPTILFILERLRRRGAARPCVALGFGPGLTAEAALLV